jgi:hypothetical protein
MPQASQHGMADIAAFLTAFSNPANPVKQLE